MLAYTGEFRRPVRPIGFILGGFQFFNLSRVLLMTDQNIIFYTKPSLRRAYFFSFVFVGLLLYGRFQTGLDPRFDKVWYALFGVLLVLLAYAHLRRLCTGYIITNHDVQVKSGIIARQFCVVPYRRITNVAARQSVLDRILGLVDLYLDSAGSDVQEVSWKRVTVGDAREAGSILRQIIQEQASPQSLQAGAVDNLDKAVGDEG